MSMVAGIAPSDRLEPGQIVRPAGAPGSAAASGAGQGLQFSDIIDVVNPLQHIPGVSELYRALTNDQISEGARFAGNALYGVALGGPIGLAGMTAYSLAGSAVESVMASDEAPLPDRPAEVASLETVASEETIVPVSKPIVSNPDILGVEVGAATANPNAAPSAPLDLNSLTIPLEKPGKSPAEVRPLPDDQGQASPMVGASIPSRDALGTIADHSANRLPLDILEVLQARHKALESHEQS